MRAQMAKQHPALWRPVYWLYAVCVPVAFMAFEIAKIVIYETSRAPNVSAARQIALLALFYAFWVVVPRILWMLLQVGHSDGRLGAVRRAADVISLGVGLSAIHLFGLTVLLLFMYAPAGWDGGQLIASFGEVWLANAPLWFFAYFGTAALIDWRLRQIESGRASKLEVRKNGRLTWISTEHVLWIRSAGKTSDVITVDGTYTIRASLAELSENLGSRFLRTHRSALVNARHIKAVQKRDYGSGYIVRLAEDETAPLSRRKLGHVKASQRGTS